MTTDDHCDKLKTLAEDSKMDASRLYGVLSNYLLNDGQLISSGFAQKDPRHPDRMQAPRGVFGPLVLNEVPRDSYVCFRCQKSYQVDRDGFPLPNSGPCINHPGNLKPSWAMYTCCNRESRSEGCSIDPLHVHKGDMELYNYSGFVETQEKAHLDPNQHGVYALDCKVIYTVTGLELARVSVVDHNQILIYDKLVRPTNKIVDCNTRETHLTIEDLKEQPADLKVVQTDLLRLFSNKTILIGHNIMYDMKFLKIFHERFVDAAILYPPPINCGFSGRYSLGLLMRDHLRSVMTEYGLDTKEDARAALQLVLYKIRNSKIEGDRYF